MSLNLGTAVFRVLADMSNFVTNIRKGSDVVRNFGESMKRVGGDLRAAGLQLSLISAGLAKVFTPLIKSGAEFERTMSRVLAVSLDSFQRDAAAGLGSVDEQFKKLTDTALAFGKQATFNAVQVGEALFELGAAGLTAAEQVQALPGVLDLAVAGLFAIGEAAEISANLMFAFGLSASDISGRIADTLVFVANATTTTIDQIAEGFKYASASGGALGLQIEEVAAALGVLSNSGIKASLSGTALNQVFNVLARQQKELIDTAASYGLSLEDIDITTHSLEEVLQAFNKVGITATDVARTFEVRAGRAFNALQNNIDKFGDLAEAVRSSAGAVKAAADIMRDNFLSVLERIKATLTTLGDQIFLLFATRLKEITQQVQEALLAFDEWSQSHTELIVTITALGTAIFIAASALSGIILVIGLVISAVGSIIAVFGGFELVIMAVVNGAIIGGIVAAMYSLKDSLDEITVFVDKAVGAFTIFKDALIEGFGKAFESFVAPSLASIKDQLLSVMESFGDWYDEISRTGELEFWGRLVGVVLAEALGVFVHSVNGAVLALRGLYILLVEINPLVVVGSDLYEFAKALGYTKSTVEEVGEAYVATAEELETLNKRVLDQIGTLADAEGKERELISLLTKKEKLSNNEKLLLSDLIEARKEEGFSLEDNRIQITNLISEYEGIGESLGPVVTNSKEYKAVLTRLYSLLDANGKSQEGLNKALRDGADISDAVIERGRAEVALEIERTKIRDAGKAATEELKKTENSTREEIEKNRVASLEGMDKEIETYKKQAEAAREKSFAIEEALKTENTAKYEQSVKNIENLEKQKKILESKLPTAQVGQALKINERIKIVEADILATEEKRTKEQALFNEKLDAEYDARYRLKIQADAALEAIHEKARVEREEFIEELILDEAKASGDKVKIAELEKAKKIKILKEEISEKFDIKGAATEEEKKLIEEGAKEAEKIGRHAIELEFAEEVKTVDKEKEKTKKRELDLEGKILQSMYEKVTSARELFNLEMALYRVKIAKEQEAEIAARKALNLEERAKKLEGRLGGEDVRVKRLNQEAEFAAKKAAKRAEEAKLGPGGTAPEVAAEVEAAKAELVKIVETITDMKEQIENILYIDLRIAFEAAPFGWLEAFLASWEVVATSMIAEVEATMAQIKEIMDVDHHASPSLREIWQENISVIKSGVQAMTSNISNGIERVGNFSPSILSPLNLQNAGFDGASAAVSGGGGMKNEFIINNNVNLDNVRRHIGRAIVNGSRAQRSI